MYFVRAVQNARGEAARVRYTTRMSFRPHSERAQEAAPFAAGIRALAHPVFRLPLLVLASSALGVSFQLPLLYLVAIAVGIGVILVHSYHEVRDGNFSLDYIAFLALIVSAATGEYLAGAVVAFMFTGGEALEAYASARASQSLEALLARIPKRALVKMERGATREIPLASVPEGATIIVRHGELVPLDGQLLSASAILNTANLTGEALPETIQKGAFVKSGSVNEGEAIELSVSGTLKTSTYHRIVSLVADAKRDQAPLVRIADRANIPFTIITLVLATGTLLFTHDMSRALAVLVIATPCPLIIAAPIAFIGGLSRAARANIIVKHPAALEALARSSKLFFDKTGTLTLGTPRLARIALSAPDATEADALAYAAAVEFHSIHPLARAIAAAAEERQVPVRVAVNVIEHIGKGIHGTVDGVSVSLAQAVQPHTADDGIALALTVAGTHYATLFFADELKTDARALLGMLSTQGFETAVFTGDTRARAEHVFGKLPLTIYADCTPEEKYALVERARRDGTKVAVVGDGLNDAPALARADVGIVFSGTENSAAVEAASIVVLGSNLRHISTLLRIARRSFTLAKQSIVVGIGLSVFGMVLAAAGFITPIAGAVIQEVIDVVVILNALRSAGSARDA